MSGDNREPERVAADMIARQERAKKNAECLEYWRRYGFDETLLMFGADVFAEAVGTDPRAPAVMHAIQKASYESRSEFELTEAEYARLCVALGGAPRGSITIREGGK